MAVPATPNFNQGAAAGAVDQQKAALLAALAQGGTAMAQQTAAHQQVMGASTQAAAAGAAARSVNPQQAAEASGAAQAQGGLYGAISAAQGGASQAFMSNLSANSGQYMDQVKAAVPLVHAQAGREISSMQHAAGQAQADRALRTQIAQLQLQETQARIAAAGRNSGVDDRRLALDEKRLGLEERELDARLSGKSMDPIEAAKRRSAENALAIDDRSKRADSILGGEGDNARSAILQSIRTKDGDVGSFAEAAARLDTLYGQDLAKTPGGKNLDRGYMMGVLANIYGVQAPKTAQAVKGGGVKTSSGRK